MPATELVAPINRVALPGYSRMQKDEGGIQKGFLDVVGMISLVAIPIAIGIASIADLLVPLLLGNKWLDAIPVIEYLAFAGAVWVLSTNSASVMLALGRPELLTAWQAIRMVLLLPALYYGAVAGGVEGVAVAYLSISAIALVLNIGIVLKVLSLSVSRYLDVVYRPVASATLMYIVEVTLVLPWLVAALPDQRLVCMLVAVAFGATFFVVFEIILWVVARRPVGAETRIIQILGELLETRMPAISSWLARQRTGS
jgi:PST family polysaccharide transporter